MPSEPSPIMLTVYVSTLSTTPDPLLLSTVQDESEVIYACVLGAICSVIRASSGMNKLQARVLSLIGL